MIEPLPPEPSSEMYTCYEILLTNGDYPVPAGQAALWAVLAGTTSDPVAWTTQLMELTKALIEEPP